MAQGQNAKKHGHSGREYMSRRPFSYSGFGRITKTLTHRAERVNAKVALRAEIDAG